MVPVWYAIVTAMLTAWAVLDGFDFGVGIVQRLVAKSAAERGLLVSAIAPVWDGNEVWLVASGGVFVFAFPRAYAVALSGLYLPLTMVLWLLVFRGIAIELRSQLTHPLWRAGWDGVFALASAALAFVAGVALGNVVRGVPIDGAGWFQLDLFSLQTGGGHREGVIDAFTALVGLLAMAALAAHGSSYLIWKTEGEVRARSVVAARRAWLASIVLAAAATGATAWVRPSMFVTLGHRPWLWPFPAIAAASPIVAFTALKRGRELPAFAASSAFVACLLLSTAGVLYPVLLPSTRGLRNDLDAYAAASGEHGLALGLAWWGPALTLAVLYFVNLFRSTRGKVTAGGDAH
ncbi:MAG: cytochrome d ubiquinol oxidase subunit II [Myxococcota bacterium]|nr:cytochrome d ubiquinol oxidase subunit II [Myxococcota bacterium]